MIAHIVRLVCWYLASLLISQLLVHSPASLSVNLVLLIRDILAAESI